MCYCFFLFYFTGGSLVLDRQSWTTVHNGENVALVCTDTEKASVVHSKTGLPDDIGECSLFGGNCALKNSQYKGFTLTADFTNFTTFITIDDFNSTFCGTYVCSRKTNSSISASYTVDEGYSGNLFFFCTFSF